MSISDGLRLLVNGLLSPLTYHSLHDRTSREVVGSASVAFQTADGWVSLKSIHLGRPRRLVAFKVNGRDEVKGKGISGVKAGVTSQTAALQK
ncbi:hypothetical protein EVAR_74197_1 [Eumeta japonica]|uniref:Uncharacterized protein n=1 Tax=Eumeta variegata TaxID=151549 RepID=A0A4C1SC81_EUMVA|nr:hypothetical protein EVAR_74197_1 [Eumeta japonica]